MSRACAGRIWIVISRATSDCQATAAERTSKTAPVVSEARNVMIATTATSARPAIECFGTIGASARGSRSAMRGTVPSSMRSSVIAASIVHVQPALVQDETPRVVLVHQADVVSRDHHRGSGLVELNEQPQQTLREVRIDVAGRLVGEQK